MEIKPINRNFKRQHIRRSRTDACLLHHGASSIHFTAEDYFDWHTNSQGWNGIGYHFVIEWDGTIKEGRPIWATGAQAVGYNSTTIGVCLVGNFEHHRPSEAQYKALAWLLNNVILKKYPNLEIKGHRDVNATACPGRHFSFEELERVLKGGIDVPQTPQWKLDIMEEASELGLIDITMHKADEVASKWFVLAVILNAIKYIKK